MDTQALVDLQEFLKDTQNKTVYQLETEVAESADHLKFLLDYTFLSGKEFHIGTLLIDQVKIAELILVVSIDEKCLCMKSFVKTDVKE